MWLMRPVECMVDTQTWLTKRTGVLALVLLVAVILTTGMDRFIVRVDGTNYRVELLVGGIALLGAVTLLGVRSWRALGTVECALILWLVTAFVSSAFISPATGDSLRLTLILAGLLCIYLAVVLLVRSRAAMLEAVLLWVAISTGVVLVGVIQGLLFSTFGITTGMHFNRQYNEGVFSAIPMVTGTVWEPNLYGSFALALGSVTGALAFSPSLADGASQWRLRGATSIAFAGAVVSMTRAVWFAAVVIGLCLALAAYRFGRSTGRGAVLKLAGSMGLGLIIGLGVALSLPTTSWKTDNPGRLTLVEVAERAGRGVRGELIEGAEPGTRAGLGSALEDRAGELGSPQQIPSLLLRQEILIKSFEGWQRSPVLGWGSGAYRYVYTVLPGEPGWIPNIFMHILFENGLLGFLFFFGALGLMVVRAISGLRKPASKWETSDYATLGLLLAGVALLITYQLTDGTWMGFTWVLLALLSSASNRSRVARQ